MNPVVIDKNVPQYPDTEIIDQILAGNSMLFEILIRRYNPVLYKTGRGYGFSHEDTEDLMQEAFINSFLGMAGFEKRSLFKTWLVRIMLNLCYHKSQKADYKKKSDTQIIEDKTTGAMFLTSNSNNPGNSLINKELNAVVESILSTIPEDYRLTFTLRELNGLSTSETAEVLNITTSNVKVRLNRAKAMLRKEIEKIYTPDEIYEFNLVYCDKIVIEVMKKIKQSNKV